MRRMDEVRKRARYGGVEVEFFYAKENLDERGKRAVWQAANYYRARVQRNLSRVYGPGGGRREYNLPGVGKYWASAPGEYPGYRSGDLHKSIFLDPARWQGVGRGNTVAVGSEEYYARYLETGTVNMQPRTTFYRTYLENEGTILAIMRGHFSGDLRRLRHQFDTIRDSEMGVDRWER